MCNKFDFRLFVLNCIICVVFGQSKTLEQYCWRDYEGTIPGDALPGGLDRNGQVIYVGQVLFVDKLVPGKIYTNDTNIYIQWADQEKVISQNVKILCSDNPENFKWMKTKYNEVTFLTNQIIIKGGFEPDYSTYIGRVFTDGETSVGKVICSVNECLGLFTTNNGQSLKHEAFEILTYSPPAVLLAQDPYIFD